MSERVADLLRWLKEGTVTAADDRSLGEPVVPGWLREQVEAYQKMMGKRVAGEQEAREKWNALQQGMARGAMTGQADESKMTESELEATVLALRKRVTQVEEENRSLQAQLQLNEKTCQRLRAQIRDGRLRAQIRDGALAAEEDIAAQRRARMQELDRELHKNGAIEAPEVVTEETLGYLMTLAQRNEPVPGNEVNEPEVALLIRSIIPLILEIERLEDILLTAMTVYPCHNPSHAPLHEDGGVCNDQLSLMAILLVREVNLPPGQMRRAAHKRGECTICDDPPARELWLNTGVLTVGYSDDPEEVLDDELPWADDPIEEDDLPSLARGQAPK